MNRSSAASYVLICDFFSSYHYLYLITNIIFIFRKNYTVYYTSVITLIEETAPAINDVKDAAVKLRSGNKFGICNIGERLLKSGG